MKPPIAVLASLLLACATRSTGTATPGPSISDGSTPQGGPAARSVLRSQGACELPGADAQYAAMLLPFDESRGAHDHGHGTATEHGGAAQAPPAIPDALLAEAQRLRRTVDDGRCRRIVYDSDGLAIHGYVLEPPADGSTPTRRPAVLVARGGNRDLGAVGPLLLLELQALVDAGYVVIATQYRGAAGSEGRDEFGGADVADLRNLVAVARELDGVDPEALFLLGYSRGGMMAALALREGLPVRAAAMWSGAFDLEAGLEQRPEMQQNYRELMPDFDADPEAALRRRSAVHWGEQIETPTLLLAGSQDWRTPIAANAVRLAEVMKTAGREVALVTYDDGHMLRRHRREAYGEIVRWFETHRASDDP